MDVWFISREVSERQLRDIMHYKEAGGPHSEEDIANLLRILFGEINPKEELMKEFACEEVVDYVLTLFDDRGIREIIFMTQCFNQITLWPISALATTRRLSMEDKAESLKKIAQIYLDHSMRDDYRATRRAYWDVVHGTFAEQLLVPLNDFE